MTLLLKLISFLIPGYDIPFTWTKFKKILVVDLNYLGDMVQSSVIYRDLKERFPGASVEALVLEEMITPLNVNPYVSRIHTVPSMSIKDGMKAAFRLRKEKYDLVIQLNTSLKINLLLYVAGKRYRLGYDYKHRGCFLNIRVPTDYRTNRMGSRVEEILRLTNTAFGDHASSREMIFPANPTDLIELRYRLRQEYGVTKGDILVGMHTVCRTTKEKRQWARFTEVGMELLKNPRIKIILTGSREDREYVSQIAYWLKGGSKVINLAGEISLRELPALLSDLALFITINTGPMHIAIANHVPTYAIIGGSPASVVFPKGDTRYRYIQDPALSYVDACSDMYDLHPDPDAGSWMSPDFKSCISYITGFQVLQDVLPMIETYKNRAVNW